MNHDDEPVGLVGIFRPRPGVDVAELVSMWVAPEGRRTGTGRRLVEAAVQWATDSGFEAVELWVTRGNDGARLLYEVCGFSPTGTEQALPSDPCLTEDRMRLQINR